jgi:hypothetical protein
MVRFSALFKARFARHCAEMEANPTRTQTIKDFASAKHRFESHQKPLGRLVIFFDASLITAQEIFDERGINSKEGAAAHDFLEFVNDESALQLSMMADCADENLILVRFLDDAEFDKSALAYELDHFQQRCQLLFGAKQGCLSSGYTQHMLRLLRKPRVLRLRGGEVKTLGGMGRPSQVIIDKCMQRMQNWMHLARQVTRAEFPNFDCLGAFALFRLDPKSSGATQSQTDCTDEFCQRLAKVANVDWAELKAQVEDHRPYALQTQQSTNCSVSEAWKASIDASQRTRVMRERHPADALRRVLWRFGAYGGSTSGVERVFAMGKSASGINRTDLQDCCINDDLLLLCDQTSVDDTALVRTTCPESFVN